MYLLFFKNQDVFCFVVFQKSVPYIKKSGAVVQKFYPLHWPVSVLKHQPVGALSDLIVCFAKRVEKDILESDRKKL